jgi:hypothetical protein
MMVNTWMKHRESKVKTLDIFSVEGFRDHYEKINTENEKKY